MLSGKLLCLLLALTFSSSRNTGAVDVTVSSGDTAFLPCPLLFKYSDFMKISVKWEKDEVKEPSLCTYFINSNETLSISQCGRRFKVNTEPLGLNITDVESNDAGVYKCVMTKLIPPPTAENSSTLMLKVSALTLQLMNSTNSSCVELLCSLKGLRPQQVNFTWTRATQLLYHHESSSMRNTLTLCKPHWTDGETLTCQASYSNNHTLYSKSITLPCDSGSCNIGEGSWLTIIIISTCAGLLLLILLGVAFFKCKERGAANGSIVYSNKIYENFTFSSATINTTSSSQNAQPGAGSNIRSTTTSNQQIIRQTQREECIYEN
ncbi:uncharacterized protein LOC117599311 isoform X2 [Pangasianodon hypophthalmus]|uniref:uncharacterized protein LOC117599311 isoform X2 n=1 Tax=Pangasianodon hypophthalmus TaxID=310915 RepID=UPI0023072080|nr:uncharacterized protein LOC117599311 isoform X2 [Pangasianodon hypophthalmus]